ncbi:MAG: chemotaxis protein CheW [Pseudomonadota bacterium]
MTGRAAATAPPPSPAPAAFGPAEAQAGGERLVLAFSLDGETYALGVERVTEVIDPPPLTPVPHADALAPAVVNVRGSVIPFIDLRHRLGLPAARPDAPQRLLVIELDLVEETTRLATAADEVETIVELPAGAVEPVPTIGMRLPTAFIEGVAKHGDGILVLLDPETVFPPASERAAHANGDSAR